MIKVLQMFSSKFKTTIEILSKFLKFEIFHLPEKPDEFLANVFFPQVRLGRKGYEDLSTLWTETKIKE